MGIATHKVLLQARYGYRLPPRLAVAVWLA